MIDRDERVSVWIGLSRRLAERMISECREDIFSAIARDGMSGRTFAPTLRRMILEDSGHTGE